MSPLKEDLEVREILLLVLKKEATSDVIHWERTTCGWPLGDESDPWLTASKRIGTSVLTGASD